MRNETIKTAPEVSPSIIESIEQLKSPEWKITVFDNNYNTYEEVITILILATGCGFDEAHAEAWEIDHYGKCIVHRGPESECQIAAKLISRIGIQVEVCLDLD